MILYKDVDFGNGYTRDIILNESGIPLRYLCAINHKTHVSLYFTISLKWEQCYISRFGFSEDIDISTIRNFIKESLPFIILEQYVDDVELGV